MVLCATVRGGAHTSPGLNQRSHQRPVASVAYPMQNEERLDQVILSTRMGDITPLWGIVIDRSGCHCECRLGVLCDKPGKHPRNAQYDLHHGDWSSDPGRIIAWHKLYPEGNFGVKPRTGTLALDLDHRTELKKYGPADLELLAEWHGENVAETISVISGRNHRSKHLYLTIPAGCESGKFSSPYPAIEIIINGYCVAPGSMHLSGNPYRFSEECSPLEINMAELSGWLLAHLYNPDTLAVDLVRDHTVPPTGSIPPGQYRHIDTVRASMLNDQIAGPLMRGEVTANRSKSDYALLCKLAFYTAHHWHQYLQLSLELPITKQTSWVKYNQATVDKAFVNTRFNWESRPKPATGRKPGRNQSDDTRAVIQAISDTPSLKPSEIASVLGILPAKVYNILSRYRSGFYQTR
jgi:Bifunctional DNA primase/polymerase, N-terminal